MEKASHPFCPRKEQTGLLIIDVQDSLMRAMESKVREKVVNNIKLLIALSGRINFPLIYSEQYPKGLGRTIPELRGVLPENEQPVEKLFFSCCGEEAFNSRFRKLAVKTVILAGVETHICVLQTVLDLLSGGYTVHVASDAVCSRYRQDWEVGLRLMDKAGAVITTTETLVFELLAKAGTDDFKFMSNLLK